MKITEKLPLDASKRRRVPSFFATNLSHDQERFCVYACPANLYALNEKGERTVEFAGCLECGACMIACVYGSVKWKYPKSGLGIPYRFG